MSIESMRKKYREQAKQTDAAMGSTYLGTSIKNYELGDNGKTPYKPLGSATALTPTLSPAQSKVDAVESIWDRGSTTSGSKAAATSNLANQITDLENRRKAMEAERSSIYSSLSDPATFDRSKLSQLGNYDAEIQSLKDQMEELSKIRPEYKTEEAEARYKTYTNAEERIKSKYGSVEALVKDLETRAAELDRQTEKLKQLEAQYKENPSEKLYTEYTKAYEGYTKAAKTYQGLYLDYQPLQQAWQDYEAYDVAAQGKAGVGETAKRIAQAGITQVGSALWQTAALGEKALGSVLPGISTPITDEANRVKAAAERNALAVKEATHGHGKMAELGGDVGVAAIAAVPQAVLAFLTRGQSLAESSLASGIGPNAGLAGSLMNTIKSAMKNPSYLASMAQTLGPDFQEAKNAGASDLEAAATALIASSINAGVEIGGGLEKLGDADGTLVERILKSGHEEGWEEVLQGIISGTVNKGIYDFDKPIASLTDQNAILNPQRMATEYGTGAAVGMLLSGGTEVLASGARKATNKALGSVEARPIEKPAQLSPAADPAAQQVQAQAEITQAQNPESDVLDAATTLFTQQGMNLKTAQKRAEIVGKLVRGEEVSDKELNRIDPTNAQTKRIFTQLTGVQFPAEATSIEKLRDLYRSAHTVAEAAKTAEQQALERANVMTAQYNRPMSLAEQMAEAGYQTSAETQTRIDEENAKLASQVSNLDIGPDGKPLANLSTFAEAYRARVNPNATDKVIREQYAKFRDESRTILFGGHRLTKSQFTKLMRDNGKNLTNEQVNTLFNQAILDTLDGKDAFDRYTKKGGTDDKSSGGGISTKQKEAKTDGRTEQAYEGRSEVGDQRSQGKRRATQEGLRGADESAAGEHLRDGSLHGGDHQRTGESAGSVQETGRRAEAGDGRGMETRNSSAGEVREREIKTAHGLGTRAVGERGQSPRDSAESEALNIAVGKAEVPTFKSWNEAFLYFEHGAGQATGFSFGDPPMLADEMTLGTGKPWKAVKTYPITKEGLAQFQSDIPNLLRGDVGSAVDSVPDFVGKKHALTFAEKKKNAHKVTVGGHTYDAVSGADYTSAMHKIARQARKLGFRINFVYGDVHSSTGTCDGLTLPKTRQILVSVDSANYLKTARHEMFHARTAIDPGLHKTLLDRVREEGLLSEFRDAYSVFEGKWSDYNDLLLDAWTYQFKIENEVFAEACAKATGHHEGVKAFFDIVQEEVDRWDAEHGASHAGDTKPLGNPSLDTLREWYGDQLGEFDLNDLTDEYDDFLESYHIPDKLPHSAVDVDVLNDYLDQLVESRGADFARDISSAIQDLELSRRVAEVMSEIEASVGAAKSGFDPYSHLQNEYGAYGPGENPSRAVDLPLQTKDDNKVGRTPRNVMEAEATPESRIESIEQAVVDHKFSYRVGHNKIMVRRAEAAIRKNGWAESLTNWTRDVRDGKVNADLVAMGAVLLDNAGNSDMAGERYVQLVVDYHDLLHAAGQATQAARILKNLTPGARLYGLRGYAKNMTERIRKGDPAHNIPVEKWMEVTGNLLADRLRKKLNVPKKHAKTVSQTILSDLNAFAKTAFPEQEKTPGRTEMDRINDLFNNYEKYKEAWDTAKETIKKEYADMPEALEVFNNFLETDLADTFIGQYFGHPEIRIDKALQDKFLAAETDEERDAVTEEITKNIAQQIPATFMDKFTALRYLNMLGNFKTQIRNVTGNALNAGLTKGKNQVATLVELAVIKAGGKIERTKSFKKDPEVYRAALKDAEKMMDAILAGGKYEDGRRFDANIEKYRTIFKNKALEKYRKITNEAMSRGDAVFSKIAYADALAGYLSAHGKTFETAGTELLDNARAYAMKQAAEATFRDSNMFSDAIVAMRFRNPDTIAKKALNMIGEGILPFRKTPANILVRAVEYSPVGVITTMAETVYGKKTGTFNANKLIDSLAKNATGTMIFAVGALLSNLGLLKGKEPDEDKEKEFDALTGHQAYSIELPNGMSLTLDWLAPSSVPLFLGAQFAENAADSGLSFRDVLTAMGAITDPMLQMSMLQGLDDALANASTYGDDSALVRFTGNALWSFLTQGLTNTMLGQLERSLSNERSTTYRDKHKDVPDGIQYLIGKTLEKVPLPGADYGQIPYIDAWGRIETNARTNFGNVLNQFFVPSYVSWVEESKMEKELRRLYEANPDENASVLISRPKSYFNVDNKRKDLTAEEFIEYATTRGQTAYNVATDLTESKIYGTLSDKQKTEAILKAYDFANQMAKAVTTGYTPDKWDEDAPEGSVNPDNWVKEAMTCATEYGVPVGEYAAIYAATKDLESYKNNKGETVDNSKSLKVAVAIYDMGLSDAETKILLEAFGVNQTVRKYSEKTVRVKLKAMKEKYE